MRPYEVMTILEPALEESAVQAIINRGTELLENGGATVNRVDKWGKRRFAYEIDKRTEGFYVLFEITADNEPLGVFDNFLRLHDEVIRHKVVRIPDHVAGYGKRKRPSDGETAEAASAGGA
jgi:small subunit ribosomal protein S6